MQKAKILFLHNHYKVRGGEDSVVDQEIELFRSKGHEVDVLFFDNEQISGIFSQLKVAFSAIYSVTSRKILRKKVKEFQPDIVHIHNFFPMISPSVFRLLEKMKIPFVMTTHNFRTICANALLLRNGSICEKCIDKKFPLAGIKNKCYRDSYLQSIIMTLSFGVHKVLKTFNKASAYFVLTSFQKEKLSKSSFGVDSSKLWTKPNFVDDFGFSKNPRKNHFLFVGRLSDEKGLDLLLDAFTGSDYELKIAGTGPLLSDVKKAIINNKNIEYLGLLSKEEVKEQLKSCRAIVVPSKCYEGMPMTILEGYSTGVPVVCSNMGGMAAVVDHEKTGYNFKPFDVNDLRTGLKYIAESDNYIALQKNARRKFETDFSKENNYQLQNDYYNQLINGKS